MLVLFPLPKWIAGRMSGVQKEKMKAVRYSRIRRSPLADHFIKPYRQMQEYK